MRKILVLRGGALGDFLVTLPALTLLRERWPTARIELAGNATAAALAQNYGLLDAVHSQHDARWAALFATSSLPAEFSAWLASFDLVLNFWPDPDGDLRAKFPLRTDQIFLHGGAVPTRAPAAAHYCEPLRALGLVATDFCFQLRQREADARLIAIHPGSGSPRKNWPLDRWTALAEWLVRDQHHELLIVTGEAESDAARALARFGAPAHQLPLDELAGRLARCRLFLGHDSGVSHLAAACGVPGVLLFGPTDPSMWAPPTPHVRVLERGESVAEISLAEVQAAVLATLAEQK